MDSRELHEEILACAKDLQATYGDGLVAHVEAALRGGADSGQSPHMIDWEPVNSAAIAGLLIAIVNTMISYASLKLAAARDKKLSQAQLEELCAIVIAAVEELGPDQQANAQRVAKDALEWFAKKQA